ncbi:Cell cycle checkpoint protein RAD17 [Tolypocladium capitatum]|uniref:Cell cycle checkpoint protein RAD17 n=1 Tax=Tolypocladium capitatum TaxID=45235 RepID=A0A2K3QDP8_9HYPO|nr:Cell cycle checkpoint protein RAD17 [Tolypocladium capitatum]
MATFFSRLMGLDSESRAINLPSVEIHRIETDPDRRARCLKHLLKANHVNYSIMYHNLSFHNHTPHLLSAAYLLGASDPQLQDIYEAEIKELEPWTPSPAELMDLDWMDFLGDKRYQRAYVDYFEDKLAMEFAYDWKRELQHFLFSGDEPLFHGLIGGLGHPLIHLGYAYEMDCKEIAMEALGLACVERDFLQKYIANAAYTKPSPLVSNSPLDLLIKMSTDERFKRLPEKLDFLHLEALFDEHEDLFMEYWNAWEVDDPVKQFQLSQEAAVALLVTSVKLGTHSYDFFLVHLLTASHAVRVFIPFTPPQHHITLVREWWLLVIAVFIVKGRPRPDPDNIEKDIGGKNWEYVQKQALASRWLSDAHFVKAIRAMKEAAETWGDANEGYLRAAVTLVDNFEGWAFSDQLTGYA